MNREIRGLTLIRPWGYAIAHCGKNIENRTWACFLPKGSLIAIHSGKKWEDGAIDYLRNHAPHSQIPTKESDPSGQIIAIARFEGNIFESDSPWFQGPIGWLFDAVQVIEPIPHSKGSLGLWHLPEETQEEIIRQSTI